MFFGESVQPDNPPQLRPLSVSIDPLLLPYLHSTEEADAQRLAEDLIVSQARPIIRDITRYKLPGSVGHSSWSLDSQDFEDVCSDVILELLAWLRKFKTDPELHQTTNFLGLVAVIAYRACAAYLRRKHPRRLSLKNRISYALAHNRDLALWKDGDGEWLCGLCHWSGHSPRRTERLELLRNRPGVFEETLAPHGEISTISLPDLLFSLFEWLGSPIRLDDLVSAIAELWGIRDHAPVSQETATTGLNHHGPGSVTTRVEQRLYLERIWFEVGQ